jgi:hypothetical protein
MLQRLQANWVYGALPLALVLLALAPLLALRWTPIETLVFLALPVYMLHQYEEHDNDRFRRFVNTHIAGGRDALSVAAVFYINMLGVWAVSVAVIWLVLIDNPAWGLIVGYLLLVNAVAHIVQGLVFLRYNPGLLTAILLFLPLGAGILFLLLPVAEPHNHAISLAFVLAIHAWILIHVRRGMKTAEKTA